MVISDPPGPPHYGTAVVGTVSGSGISFGTPAVFESANTGYTAAAWIGNGKVVITYGDGGNSWYGTAVVGTVNGDDLSFGAPVVFESASSPGTSVTSIRDGKVVIAHRDDGNGRYGTAVVFTAFTSPAHRWLGIAETNATDAPATIVTQGGVASNQSNLTTGGTYYLADDGTLTTTDASRKIGRALSPTELLITGDA